MTSGISLSLDPALLQFERIHAWLAASYWSPGIDRATVERAAQGSMCVGAYRGGEQIGYARLITDRATFAWLADVIVVQEARGAGIGRLMVAALLDQPDIAPLRRIMLSTRDAHGVYAAIGFTPPIRPDFLMERLGAGVAERMTTL